MCPSNGLPGRENREGTAREDGTNAAAVGSGPRKIEGPAHAPATPPYARRPRARPPARRGIRPTCGGTGTNLRWRGRPAPRVRHEPGAPAGRSKEAAMSTRGNKRRARKKKKANHGKRPNT
ncbi:hypothetical protein SLA_3569 [Streptomyces laurentii]|uniref:Uncharacterized protein n=1 Tax=Streptomyces laurentii TaxID=39478 RepID=A0A160NZP0_STRLU|nr:hypothetical protein SLA_3569 [Streptomyces laurentii]